MKNAELTKENILAQPEQSLYSLKQKVLALLGFSRVYIGFFVLAQSALGAIMVLEGLPAWDVVIIGTIACLAGSYSLVAFNDLLDVPIDKLRFDRKLREIEGFDMGSAFERHPVARGIISYKLAVAWIVVMGAISGVGIAYLNTRLIIILPVIAIFVAAYSLLSLKSPLKVLAVAMAVTLGGIAGWIAIAPSAGILFWLFVAWTFSWEIGGRNIPNDFNDVEEDTRIGVKTFPVIFGCDAAAHIIIVFLILTSIISLPMVWLATGSYLWVGAAFVLDAVLLLIPGWRLLEDSVPTKSMKLYNRSAFYPLAMLFLLLVAFYV
ncbi:MAG TPA: hypothetical protein ENH57_03595 [Actinobacteria bacterium]|nr:hypothetical protein [Actinomycetota bacterium]